MASESVSFFPQALPGVEKVDSQPHSPPHPNPRHRSNLGDAASDPNGTHVDNSDADLLKSIGTGNKEALSVLFRRYAPKVHRVCQRILRDEAEAEDIMQDIFVFLWTKASQFDPAKGSATSWIFQVTYSRALDRRRYLNFRHHYDHRDFTTEPIQTSSSPGQVSITEIAAKSILERLRVDLSTTQYRTLEMSLFQGYTLREIATDTDQTVGAVRNQYYRGLSLIRSYLFPLTGTKEPVAGSRKSQGVTL